MVFRCGVGGGGIVLLLGVTVEAVAAVVAVAVGSSSEQCFVFEWWHRSVKVALSEECDVARRDGERLLALQAKHEQDVGPCFIAEGLSWGRDPFDFREKHFLGAFCTCFCTTQNGINGRFEV